MGIQIGDVSAKETEEHIFGDREIGFFFTGLDAGTVQTDRPVGIS